MRLRIRLDAFHPNVSVDLKTSRFALTRTFIRDAIDTTCRLMYSLGRPV